MISNHPDCQFWADLFEIPYCHFSVTSGKKTEQEQQVLEELRRHQVDVVVMARYMQILSNTFLDTV